MIINLQKLISNAVDNFNHINETTKKHKNYINELQSRVQNLENNVQLLSIEKNNVQRGGKKNEKFEK